MTYPDYPSHPQQNPVSQPQANGFYPSGGQAPGGAPYLAGGPGHPAAPYPYSLPGQPHPWGQAPAAANYPLPWFLGLLALIPFPFLGSVAGGLAQVGAGLSRKEEGVGRTQARQAASWGLTYSLSVVVLTVAHFWMLYAYTQDGPTKDFFPVGIPLTLLAVVTLLHLVLSVVGGVRATKGKTMPFFGIPFFR